MLEVRSMQEEMDSPDAKGVTNPASESLAETIAQMDHFLANFPDFQGSPRASPHQSPYLASRVNHNNGHHPPQNGLVESSSPQLAAKKQHAQTIKLLEELRYTLDSCGERGTVFRQLPPDTQVFLQQLVPPSNGRPAAHTNGNSWHNGNNGLARAESFDEEKVRKLESENDDLQLQVSVLNEQIQAQSEKAKDLESIIDSMTQTRECTEEMVENELLSRTNLETHKLDLMAENSSLKLKVAAIDKDKHEAEEKYTFAQKRIDELQGRLNERTIELTELRAKAAKQSVSSLEHSDSFRGGTMDKEKTIERLRRKHNEVDKLKKAVEALVCTNDEKDKHIDELRRLLKRYRRIEELVLTTQGRKGLEQLGIRDDDSDTSSTHNSAGSSVEQTVREVQPFERLEIVESQENRPHPSMHFPSATSTPVNHASNGSPKYSHQNGNGLGHTQPSAIMGSPLTRSPAVVRSNSCEDITPLPQKTPPTARRRGEGFGTLPKDVRLNTSESPSRSPKANVPGGTAKRPPPSGKPPITPSSSNSSTGGRKRGPFMSFGKGLFKKRTGSKWSSSAPNLAQTDDEAIKDEMAQAYKQMANADPQKKKSKGLKRFFGKLRRSSSQDLDPDIPDGQLTDFKRGGVRATAGPRLGWSKDLKYHELEMPFSRWDTDRIVAWLHSMGLSMYVGDCRRSVKNGAQLLKMNQHSIEKELNVKNHFHRKKLQLAIQSVGSDKRQAVDNLDYNWVTRWLDDIGLPQYKEPFQEARVDGRMLHYMTVEDLVSLKVTNAMHHLSIKRGIQVLRTNNFNPICLKRRPAPDEGQLQDCPDEVSLWTNHRVMEWLRSIDLSEYAPNLRGSGVHGGLMVLEPRYGAEIFACILSIPASKTLLRRHLSTHFVALIGNNTQMGKREYESAPGSIPLTPNQKVKLKKFGIFKGHRRSGSDPNNDDFICPLDLQDPSDSHQNGGHSLSRNNSSLGKSEKEHMLARDHKFLDDVPTSDV